MFEVVVSGGSLGCSEDIDIGEGARIEGLRDVAALGCGFFDAARGLSSSVSESSFFATSARSPSSSSSLDSSGMLCAAGFFGGAFFAAGRDLMELSDSVVGMRGTFEGRSGLKAGVFRLLEG